MNEIRNILLIGRIGSGKSTLANVLLNKEENFEEGGIFREIFTESDSSLAEVKNVESEEVEINGVKYCIIDTVGIGNDKLDSEEITHKIFETCYKFEKGLTQIFFLFNGRINLQEIKVYNIVRKKIFDKSEKDIAKYTTIVRTGFHGFRDKKKCDEDYKVLKKENKKITELIGSINPNKEREKFIYINNLSLKSDYTEEEIVAHKRWRKDSRDVVLLHLENLENLSLPYKSESLELISEVFNKIADDRQKKDEFMELLKEKKKEYEGRNSAEKLAHKALTLNEKKGEERNVIKSSLRAAIEIKNICKQM